MVFNWQRWMPYGMPLEPYDFEMAVTDVLKIEYSRRSDGKLAVRDAVRSGCSRQQISVQLAAMDALAFGCFWTRVNIKNQMPFEPGDVKLAAMM